MISRDVAHVVRRMLVVGFCPIVHDSSFVVRCNLGLQELKVAATAHFVFGKEGKWEVSLFPATVCLWRFAPGVAFCFITCFYSAVTSSLRSGNKSLFKFMGGRKRGVCFFFWRMFALAPPPPPECSVLRRNMFCIRGN